MSRLIVLLLVIYMLLAWVAYLDESQMLLRHPDTKQFKEQAIKLVIDGQDPTYAARELGLPYSTLRNWLEKAGG